MVLGANQLGIDPGYENLVRVTGYLGPEVERLYRQAVADEAPATS